MLVAGAAAAGCGRRHRKTSHCFLRPFPDAIEENRAELADLAHEETCYAKEPRLNCIDLPRTSNQLRQADNRSKRGVPPVFSSFCATTYLLNSIGDVFPLQVDSNRQSGRRTT
jgi:hypothetical protein